MGVKRMPLTEAEVAERLRCSTSKIKRLRLAGKLPYLPGRPVLITEDDLDAFISSHKRGRTTKRSDEQRLVDEAREWALRQTLLQTKKRGRA